MIVTYLGTTMDVEPEDAAALGIVAGQEITTTQRCALVTRSGDRVRASVGLRLWDPQVYRPRGPWWRRVWGWWR